MKKTEQAEKPVVRNALLQALKRIAGRGCTGGGHCSDQYDEAYATRRDPCAHAIARAAVLANDGDSPLASATPAPEWVTKYRRDLADAIDPAPAGFSARGHNDGIRHALWLLDRLAPKEGA